LNQITYVSAQLTTVANANSTVYIHFPKPKTIGRQIWPPHQATKGPATPLKNRLLNVEC